MPRVRLLLAYVSPAANWCIIGFDKCPPLVVSAVVAGPGALLSIFSFPLASDLAPCLGRPGARAAQVDNWWCSACQYGFYATWNFVAYSGDCVGAISAARSLVLCSAPCLGRLGARSARVSGYSRLKHWLAFFIAFHLLLQLLESFSRFLDIVSFEWRQSVYR